MKIVALRTVRIGLSTLALVASVAAQEARFFRMAGPAPTVITAFTPDGYITWLTLQPVPNYTVQTARSLAGPSNWVDYVQVPTINWFTTNRLYAPNPPSGMALIPAGSFTMGDTLDGESDALDDESDAIPTNIYVSAFYMDTNLVSYALWTNVYQWATAHGYSFGDAGSGKAANHPVQTVEWYDVVKWCNARSQQAHLAPVYYTDAGFTQVYTNEQRNAVYANWSTNGYRLPTEAEWEKAARGRVSGQRFPWGNTISLSQANYNGSPLSLDPNGFAYDLATAIGFDPAFNDGLWPYTSPVGSFAPNGYGLYDMAGNVLEWCWDWYDTPYGQPTITNPTGPVTGDCRVVRGGSWFDGAKSSRCADRFYGSPGYAINNRGFRCVRGF